MKESLDSWLISLYQNIVEFGSFEQITLELCTCNQHKGEVIQTQWLQNMPEWAWKKLTRSSKFFHYLHYIKQKVYFFGLVISQSSLYTVLYFSIKPHIFWTRHTFMLRWTQMLLVLRTNAFVAATLSIRHILYGTLKLKSLFLLNVDY